MQRRIENLIEKEVFSHVDMYFAQQVLDSQEESPSFFLLCYLLAIARNGHLCLEVQGEEIAPCPSLLAEEESDIEFISQQIKKAFHEISVLNVLSRYKNNLYLKKNFLLEKEFFLQLNRLKESTLFFPACDVEKAACLNFEQNQALSCALRSPLSLISGGPGTGKTFTAVEIVRAFLNSLSFEDRKIAQVKFAAPTGKAAALLEKNVRSKLGPLEGVQYGTLHSFLKTNSYETAANASVFADLFIVDEASMLDANLFVLLLSSLQGGGRLVFMGDKDQLPPVEAGGFFADLISLAPFLNIPSIALVEGLRAENASLRALAHKVLQGDLEGIKEHHGMQIQPSLSIPEIREFVWRQNQERLIDSTLSPLEILSFFEKFRVLSAMKKGPLGVESLNQMIIDRLVEGKDSNQILAIPILITENNRDLQLMNGDAGFVLAKVSSIRKGFLTLEDKAYFLSKEESSQVKEITGPMLPPFSWGYCLSIHKSQGSEYDTVLILVPPGSNRFGREILYTAVTRAKKHVHLIADEKCLGLLLKKSARKKSGLSSHFS